MRRPRPSIPLLLAASLALASPAAAATPPGGTPEELARLVPTDAFAFSQLSSIDDLDRAAVALIQVFEPGMAQFFDVDEVITNGLQGTVDVGQLRRDQPLGIALSLPSSGMPQPVPTFIFPVKDTQAYLKHAIVRPGMAAPLVIGDYVGVSMNPNYVVGSVPNPFVADMPHGQLAARVDLERLVKAFGPMIDLGLAQAEAEMKQAARMGMAAGAPPGVDFEEFMDAYLQWLRVFVDSAETFDLGLATEGSTVELTGSFTALAGSPLDGFSTGGRTGLRDLVRYLDTSASMSSVLSADMADLLGRVQPMVDAMMTIYPEETQAGFRGYVGEFMELFPLMGDTLVGDGEFDAHGLRLAYVFRPEDQQAVLDRYAALAGSEHVEALGVRVEGPEQRVVGGLPVTEYRFAMLGAADEEAALGGGGDDPAAEIWRAIYGADTRLRFVSGDGVMAMVFGGDEAYLEKTVENLKAPAGRLSPALQRAVEVVGDANPAYVASMDLARFVGQMHGLTSAMLGGASPDVKRLARMNVPVLFYGAVEGRTWLGGMSLDLAQMVEFGKVVSGL